LVCSSLYMELQIYSPSVKVMQHKHQNSTRPLPVFGDNDQVGGKVFLHSNCPPYGRLSVSVSLASLIPCRRGFRLNRNVKVEGAFLYPSPEMEVDQAYYSHDRIAGQRKHVLFSSSTTMPVAPGSETGPPRSGFREAFAVSIWRRPSVSSINVNPISVERSYPFSFDLPRSCRSGEEMPPTFSSSELVEIGPRGSVFFEVTYKVIVSWEAGDGSENQSRCALISFVSFVNLGVF
jgi:hypothetical protein